MLSWVKRTQNPNDIRKAFNLDCFRDRGHLKANDFWKSFQR